MAPVSVRAETGIVVATPGRLLDHITNGVVRFDQVSVLYDVMKAATDIMRPPKMTPVGAAPCAPSNGP